MASSRRQPKLETQITGDSSGLRRAFKNANTSAGKFGRGIAGAGRIAAVGVGALGAAAAGIGIASLKVFADFDQAMTESVAIMGDVSDEMRDKMETVARDVAKTTTFSATEAAESYFFLASAGLDAAASIAALPQVAAFAQAGNFDMATATDLVTDAQSALGLSSDDAAENLENMARVSDVLVGANTLANASVEQFATALTSKAANAAAKLGLEVEDTTAILAVFADQGIKGERAGTLLTNTLQGLAQQSITNADAFSELGIGVFNMDGSMRDMPKIVEDIEDAFAGMSVKQQTAALGQLGFNKQAKEGILALTGQHNALGGYEDALREMGGVTDEVAGKQLESFSAQMGLLKSRLIDVGITIGSKLAPLILKGIAVMDKFWADHKKTILPILKRIGEIASSVFKSVAKWIGKTLPKVIAFLQKKWEEWGPTIIAVVERIGEIIGNVFGFIRDAIAEVSSWFSSSGDDVGESTGKMQEIIKTLGEVFTEVFALIRTVVDRAVQFWRAHGDKIMAIARRIWTIVQDVIKNGLKFIKGIIKTVTGLIEGDWGKVWEGIKDQLSAIWGVIKEVIFKAIGDIATWLKEEGPGLLRTAAEKAFNAVKNGIKAIIGGLNPRSGIVGWVADRFDDIIGFFTSLPEHIVDIGRSLWDALGLQWAWDKIQAFIDFIGDAVAKVPNFGGSGAGVSQAAQDRYLEGLGIPVPAPTAPTPTPVQVGPVDRLAHGGTLTSRGLVLVGEEGPELLNLPRAASVIPLDRTGGTTIIVNIEGTVLSERDLVLAIEEAIDNGQLALTA